MTNKKEKPQERFPLGGDLEDVYFTRQEARCMICLLKGASVKSAANTMELSPRTVEYYVNNIKKKLNCHSKFDLIRLVIDHSTFPYEYDTEELGF